NQTLKTQNGATLNFLYDIRDRLVRVSQDTTTLGQFRYDHAGMRIQKAGSQGIVRYTYDDDSVLIQTDEAGATLAKYDYGPDRLLSLEQATEGAQFYHFDALGSVVNLSKPDGSLQARYQYDAWGNERASTGSSWNRFAFTGHEKDEETGLYYFKARFYDPQLGRFISQDAYLGEANTPPSLHRYLYAYANPTVYVDLNGYCGIALAGPSDCFELDAQVLGVDPATREGVQAVSDYNIGKAQGSVDTLTAAVVEPAKLVGDVVGTPIELATDGKYAAGSIERLTDRATAAVEFIKHPIDSTVKSIQGIHESASQAYASGDYRQLGQIQGSVGTGVALSVEGAGLASSLVRHMHSGKSRSSEIRPDSGPQAEPSVEPTLSVGAAKTPKEFLAKGYPKGHSYQIVDNNVPKGRVNSAGQPINEKGQFVSGAGGESAAAARGRAAHDAFDAKVQAKRDQGWVSKPRIVDADGRVHIPDARTPSGRPIEYKPNTPSGIKAGKRQLKRYEQVTGKKGRLLTYD
ncbi:MAG: hypothetical protein N0E54_15180, partial [Candidatus Thiodiazotropha taylori]|nr:hypothetical protein [Candidatus Thiodiazotropha endolucinida]MCW4230080.1 hypothetical protein [Candidatus Thiodiazotropha taylori]